MFATRVDTSTLPSALGELDDQLHGERSDAWVSALTGIGTELDKRTSHRFRPSHRSYEEIALLWTQNATAAKVIEKPSWEAYREGYEISISDEGRYDGIKQQLVDKLEDLALDASLQRAHQLKRAFGGAVVLLGAYDGRPLHEPLNESNVQSLDWLNVLEPIEIAPIQKYDDPGQARYGKPRLFEIHTSRSSGGFANPRAPKIKPGTRVHESRCIVFQGIQVSEFTNPLWSDVSPFWGNSVIHRFDEALRDYGIAFAAAGLLPADISQPVITIENLKEMLAKNKEAFRTRLRNIEISRSVARAILIDKNEKYERQTTQLANVPELLDRLSQRLAGDADVPLSVLIGYSPASLGAPDDKEITLWFNIVRAMQRHEFTRPTKRVVGLALRTLRQRRLPKHWSIEWLPLEHQTLAQKAETERTQAQTDSLNIKSGTIYPDEIRRSRWRGGYSHKTQIDERKPAPGFTAPPPAGVLPGSTSAVHGPLGRPAAMGPHAHTVSGYARRNPAAPALGANPKVGGDTPPADNRDRADVSESAYQRSALARARASGASRGAIALLEHLVRQAEADELAAHQAGACMSCCPHCAELPSDRPSGGQSDRRSVQVDADGAGEHRVYAGWSVIVEHPRGSTRSWTDADGTHGSTTMKYDYGYLVGVRGADQDSLDCYLGPSENAPGVYVIHQMSKASGFSVYDEDKAMLGFDSPNHARDAYLHQYDDERFFGGMTPLTTEQFSRWISSGDASVCTPV